MQLTRLYLQLGNFLDYYTGLHEPSISQKIQNTRDGSKIPENCRQLFPQLCVNSEWPETLLCHGTADTAVKVEESIHLYTLLKGASAKVELVKFEGKEHSFDYASNAEDELKTQFDYIAAFLLGSSSPGSVSSPVPAP
jgi:dipeptidyl aminopeptidase/acylaminoacyl peptidase